MSDSLRTSKRLNDRLIDDGFVVVDLLNAEATSSLHAAYKTLTRTAHNGFDSSILSRDTQYREAVNTAILATITTPLKSLFDGYRVAFCTFAVKSAYSTESEVPMHQDWSFVDEDHYTSMGLWCPLDDVNLDNGCLQVVQGSHAFSHPPRAACTPFAYPQLETQLREQHLTSVPMKAGQAMLFDNRLFHCSPPNHTGSERVAATAVIVPQACKLRYYHIADRQQPNRIEVFEVEDSFYLTHNAPGRPRTGVSLGFVDIRV